MENIRDSLVRPSGPAIRWLRIPTPSIGMTTEAVFRLAVIWCQHLVRFPCKLQSTI